MEYTEELLWILDKDGKRIKEGAEYQENIDFVHSLGLKCDCVGWSTLRLSDPGADEILVAIKTFCKENGWKARGLYSRNYINFKSDWYELIPTNIKENADAGYIEADAANGEKIKIATLRAFHELSSGPKLSRWNNDVLVPERFRNVCILHRPDDVCFCWAPDKGKYSAHQYFHLYCNQRIAHIAVDRELRKADIGKITELGGYLPKISDIFYELQQINLQDCYLLQDMPSEGIAYAYSPRTFHYCGRHKILIHKDFMKVLIQENAISPASVRPAAIVDALPGGYTLDATQEKIRPSVTFMEQMQAEYKKQKSTPRPVRLVSEKDALKVLRKAKREQKAQFNKAMPKVLTASLAETEYDALTPYYLIANGGYLSDEYRLLSYADAISSNNDFIAQLSTEELLEEKPQGIVIAKCPDGDHVLLCANGTVIRFSHEAPETINQWPSLAQFIFDAITEYE